jgi:LysR family transcriptional regulator, hydrogen peroxide-inducible genes activator
VLPASVSATEEAVRREGAATSRTLVVGAIPTVAPYVLPDALRRLRARDASTRVELREDYSAVLSRQLAEGTLDVVIAALPFAFRPHTTETLGTDALVVAVPASHPAARAGRISLEALHESPAITLDPAHCLGEQVAGFCSSRQVLPSVVCRSAQLATVLELVGAGVGVSIVPALAASRHNTPQTVYVPLADHTLQREIVAVWRHGGTASPAARAFVECVRETVRGW